MTEALTALFKGTPLWEMSFTAAWAAGIVFLLRLLLNKRAPKRVLCLLWLVVFARLLVPVTPESPVSLVPAVLTETASVGADIIRPQDTEQGGNSRAHTMRPYTNPDDASVGADIIRPQDTEQGADTRAHTMRPYTPPDNASVGRDDPALSTPETSAFPWEALLAGVWLAGAVGMLVYGIVTYFRLRRRVRFAVRVSGRVWEDDTVSSPFILGLFRPRVYLPSGLEGRARRFILCHEFAHLRRLDHIVKPVCWLALALHWFNPAVWAAFLLLSRDMEGACDEAVLRSLGEGVKADYSYTLLALAGRRRIPAPCPVAFDEGDAKGRIKHVLNYRKPALWIIVVSVIAVIVAAVCLLTDPVTAEEPTDSPAPSESEPSPSPSAEPSPTPDEGLNALLDPWMLAVLKGERTFTTYGEDRDIDHLKEAYRSYWRVELGKLAIIDLDKDGARELVIFPVGDDEYLYSVVGYMILRLEGDTVRGYDPGWRSIGDLKEDGTFRWSSSAFENGTGLAHFDGGEFAPELFTYVENGSCFVEGQPAAQEEFDAAMEAQDAKPEPVWYVFQDGVLKTEDEAWKDLVGIGGVPAPAIPVDPAVNVSVPVFLDTDQQRLYQRAYSLYSHLFGADTSAIDDWAWSWSEPLPPAEPVEVDGYTYMPSTGLFAIWDDLEEAALSVFTPEFWGARNTWLDNDGNPHQTFIDVDGRTYYLNGARGSSGRNPYFPDTFHLPTQNETERSFVLVGHYSEVLREGESDQERDSRLAANWETYIGYPMKLVLTENGWRFSEFHNTDTDNALLPYASQAAPNPALYPDDLQPEAGACVHGLDHVYIDRLTDGRLVYRCEEDFFPYYPPEPCAYNASGTGEGDYDGDGHKEEIIASSAGTLVLCDVVDGELKTCTFTPTLAAFPDADLSAAWFEPGNELIYCAPLREVLNGYSTGTATWRLHYDGTALSELILQTVRIADNPHGRT